MDTVTQAYRFALDPTKAQSRVLASHCGAARVAYNWGLELVRARLNEHQADPSIPGALDAARVAEGMEPGKAPGRPVVGRELQRSVLKRIGWPGQGAPELE